VTHVTCSAIIHDFLMVDAMHDSYAAEVAVAQAVAFRRTALTMDGKS